jgi:hypothetical protein
VPVNASYGSRLTPHTGMQHAEHHSTVRLGSARRAEDTLEKVDQGLIGSLGVADGMVPPKKAQSHMGAWMVLPRCGRAYEIVAAPKLGQHALASDLDHRDGGVHLRVW